MKRAVISWGLLGLCAALISGAMGWFTLKVRELERARLTAEARADLGERTRLALWRMDAAGAAIISAENSQSPAHYRVPGDHPPSPFVAVDDPLVLLHFELDRRGNLHSPEADEAAARQAGIDEAVIAARESRLAALRERLRGGTATGNEWSNVCQAASIGEIAWSSLPKDAATPAMEAAAIPQAQVAESQGQLRQQADYQQQLNTKERGQRMRIVEETVSKAALNNASQKTANQAATKQAPTIGREIQAAPVTIVEPVETFVDLGTMRAVWIGDALFLLRRITVRAAPSIDGIAAAAEPRIQGVWLDAAALRAKLCDAVTDLLPQSSLLPANTAPGDDDPLALVSFPLRLQTTEPAVPAPQPNSPLLRSLWVSWAAAAAAMLAAGLLVAGVMRLSERRASFVSSVTHELRTPLTTFRLYSDMLVEGMIKDEAKKTTYLRTMRGEADRLHHLVENVLAYSRIERGSARTRREHVDAAEMLERMQGRLRERAERDGFGFSFDWRTPEPVLVHTDVTAVEQIVFNLVDNACKYGRCDNGDRHVTVAAGRGDDDGSWWIEVRDKGPGVPATEAKRMFRPFHKSASDAAHSMPGVGLGLALSRRLAHALGGDLSLLNPGQPGARFRLRLPA